MSEYILNNFHIKLEVENKVYEITVIGNGML